MEVENLAARVEGYWTGNAAPERAQRSGKAMVAAFNGLRECDKQLSTMSMEVGGC